MKKQTKSSNINIVIENNLFSKNKDFKKEDSYDEEQGQQERQPSLQYVAPFTPEPSFMSDIRQAYSDKNMYGMRYNTEPPPIMYNPQGQPAQSSLQSRPAPIQPRPIPVEPRPVQPVEPRPVQPVEPRPVQPRPVQPVPVKPKIQFIPDPHTPRAPSPNVSLLGENNNDRKAVIKLQSAMRNYKARKILQDKRYDDIVTIEMEKAMKKNKENGTGVNLAFSTPKSTKVKPLIVSTTPHTRALPTDFVSSQLVFDDTTTKAKRGRPTGSTKANIELRKSSLINKELRGSIYDRQGKLKPQYKAGTE